MAKLQSKHIFEYLLTFEDMTEKELGEYFDPQKGYRTISAYKTGARHFKYKPDELQGAYNLLDMLLDTVNFERFCKDKKFIDTEFISELNAYSDKYQILLDSKADKNVVTELKNLHDEVFSFLFGLEDERDEFAEKEKLLNKVFDQNTKPEKKIEIAGKLLDDYTDYSDPIEKGDLYVIIGNSKKAVQCFHNSGAFEYSFDWHDYEPEHLVDLENIAVNIEIAECEMRAGLTDDAKRRLEAALEICENYNFSAEIDYINNLFE